MKSKYIPGIKTVLDDYFSTPADKSYRCAPLWPGHFEYLLEVPEIRHLISSDNCDYEEVLWRLKRLIASEHSHQPRIYSNVVSIASDLKAWYNKPAAKGGLLMRDSLKSLFRSSPRTNRPSGAANYCMGMDMITRYGANDGSLSIEDRLSLLTFAITAISRDIQSDMATAMFYAPPSADRPKLPFLTSCYDSNGKQISVFTEDNAEYVTVNLAKAEVWVHPYSEKKLASSLRRLKNEPFKYDSNNHIAYFFPEINTVFVANGNHSISAGTHYRSGCIQAKVFDISPLYEHVDVYVSKKHSSDESGLFWRNSHTGEIIFPIEDFRVALLYSACKTRNELH